MSEYDELLGRIDRETTGAPGSAQNRHNMLREAAQAIRTLSKERDMAVEALRIMRAMLLPSFRTTEPGTAPQRRTSAR